MNMISSDTFMSQGLLFTIKEFDRLNKIIIQPKAFKSFGLNQEFLEEILEDS
jgi:hypothetical protein